MTRTRAGWLVSLVATAAIASAPAAAERDPAKGKALLVVDMQEEWAKQYDPQAFGRLVTVVNDIIDHAEGRASPSSTSGRWGAVTS